ncbi:zf-HC2 domain-containing protein [Pseudonocardia sp. KRD-184]|uniref:Zf-HC2 domain-containing protein n=1 Tax=Pseudonocardia oceani TaxID=2792013 RepID=A0ABS6U230_9PSEU|nr:anti-sigma factor [Pseudonocardia oceani]MBW0094323.1 zf-HC2 domain-containing protein [Pseudonocardia oceani]MBW0100778.1 zf-HC2 domain-containing protein [Pseudonocardia oceani]MBW0113601.1 zf-HC2 domain-containing protein [Pseudonocardia oceani]MBW0126024.1 zf-HC2 domain-containing protein [Pseudonocardia oceani]MBW0126196.1 zf-HC2 domain-containing protein [Pseudonocardia oceani]
MNAEEHRTLRESLGVHALGQLPPAEATALRAHLDGCASCSAELAEIAPVVGSLGRVDPAHLDTVPAPPAWLGDRIVARAAAERIPSRPGRGGRLLLAAAAAVVLAGLAGAGGYALGTGGDPAVPREPVALRTADPAVEASATVVPHTWGVEITLAADGFRPGAVYRVVVIDDGGRAVGAGEFVGTGASPMLCNLNSSVLRADAAGFDVVDAAGRVVVHGEL